jgi:hypothetical protein
MNSKIEDWLEIEEAIKNPNGAKLAPHFGINGFTELNYNGIESSRLNYADFKHAAHVFLWTHNHGDFWGSDSKAAVIVSFSNHYSSFFYQLVIF